LSSNADGWGLSILFVDDKPDTFRLSGPACA
jgi:hypothetical protein